MKKLFDIKSPNDVPPEEPKKKRGRPKKQQIIEEPVKVVKKRGRPRKEQSEPIVEKPVEKVEKKKVTQKQTQPKPIKPDRGWKSFNIDDIELLKPCEFYVDTGKETRDIFRGYRAEKYIICTDEPYKLHVIRKRYNNLFYREIVGCASINSCPNMFPNCEKCKIYKERQKGNNR